MGYGQLLGWVLLVACSNDRPPPGVTPDAGPELRRDGGDTTLDAGPSIEMVRALPVSGGGMIVTRDGARAVVADESRDRVSVIDLGARSVAARVDLDPGSRPFRLVEDGAGRVHVVLRGPGEVATIDLETGSRVDGTAMCVEPRGIDWSAAHDELVVACAGGELVFLSRADLSVVRRVPVDRDARDVVVQGERVFVSVFRRAELLVLDWSAASIARFRPVDATIAARPAPVDVTPGVAWRTIAHPSGGVLMLHLRGAASHLEREESAYAGGGPCGAGVASVSATWFDGVADPEPGPSFGGLSLPVDAAFAPDGQTFAVADAAFGNQGTTTFAASDLPSASISDCAAALGAVFTALPAVATAFTPDGTLLSYVPVESMIAFGGDGGSEQLVLDDTRLDRRGFDVFHTTTRSTLACASCHPEGGEDGRVWDLAPTGRRRTQTLLGGIADSAPFHWSGDVPDLAAIMQRTFVENMAGFPLEPQQIEELASWLDTLPERRGLPGERVEAGRAIFDRVGCAECHDGTVRENRTVASGTFQVPRLEGVAHRAPYLHDGCAPTIAAVFDGTCGAGTHGHTSVLTGTERADLIAYVESL
jgi:DNA-binding beta-propeller fold protein YncE